uniref:wall-associated receptor kinase-like 22 n=1 Tax=Fragaria vesca subsp. vesca TaxID=101020 RepID=UPI0005C80C99
LPIVCGDVSIPYPFGIGPNSECYLEEWYEIECNNATSPHKPFLKHTNPRLEVLNISINGNLHVNSHVTFFYEGAPQTEQLGPNLTGSPFVYSQQGNRFIAASCGYFALVKSDPDQRIVGGCMSTCDQGTWSYGRCLGINCCQTTLPQYLTVISSELRPESGENVMKSQLLFANYNYSSYSSHDDSIFFPNGKETYILLPPDPTTICTVYMASAATNNKFAEMRCLCRAGFEGNPYLPTGGCRDIDECKHGNPCSGLDEVLHISEDVCRNTVGSYMCNSGFGIGFGTLLLVLAAWCAYTVIKEIKTIEQKNIFFKRNGGLLLKQQLSSGEVNIQKIKLFTSDELEKSTDNFSINRVVDHGGHGTVYKGMLADGRIVAVKKSKMVDEGQLSEFINEVVVLSQIKHRNVVRLLGCCLETEVPLLVYEFIPNGTLFQYIHEKNEDLPLTWKMRVRIATEVAGALSYLYIAASCPIYHRDIKSTNILLDEKYRVKIADFGTSRSVAVDQTHLTTLVHGMFGYLDPEYFRSSKFTEKSDVYSFGVVLVELLSGQKPVSVVSMVNEEEEYRSLAAYFIVVMQEGRLFDIINAQVLNEASTREIMTVAKLAKRCLNLNGKRRPTMKEVTTVLEAVQISMKNSNNMIT